MPLTADELTESFLGWKQRYRRGTHPAELRQEIEYYCRILCQAWFFRQYADLAAQTAVYDAVEQAVRQHWAAKAKLTKQAKRRRAATAVATKQQGKLPL